jgi:hypothetical protein
MPQRVVGYAEVSQSVGRRSAGRQNPEKRLLGMWQCFFLKLKEFLTYRQRSWPEGRVKLD